MSAMETVTMPASRAAASFASTATSGIAIAIIASGFFAIAESNAVNHTSGLN